MGMGIVGLPHKELKVGMRIVGVWFENHGLMCNEGPPHGVNIAFF